MKTAISSSSESSPQSSQVYVHSLSPLTVPSAGFIMTTEQAVDLATKILIVAKAENAKGTIQVTGYKGDRCRVTVIRNIK